MLLLPKSTAFHNSIFSGCRDSYPKPVVVVFGVTKKMSNREGGGKGATGQSYTANSRTSPKAAGCSLRPCEQRPADQLNSFATQVDYYTSYIRSKEEWGIRRFIARMKRSPAPQLTSG